MYNPTTTAKYNRERAQEFRTQAENAPNPTTRQVYLRVAGAFDTLADSAERLARELQPNGDSKPLTDERRHAPVQLKKPPKLTRHKSPARKLPRAASKLPEDLPLNSGIAPPDRPLAPK